MARRSSRNSRESVFSIKFCRMLLLLLRIARENPPRVGHGQHLNVFNSVSSESIYRFEAALFYAGAGRFMDEVLRLVSTTTPPVRAIMFDASRISDVDYSAARTLLQMGGE